LIKARSFYKEKSERQIDQIDMNIEFCAEILKSVRFGRVLG